jgi:plastocyanin
MKVALIAAVLAAAIAIPVASAGGTTLNGTVGPGFTITLTQGGKKVTKLKAGKYTIVVNDKASIHDFHLTGPGVNKTTSVSGMGKQTWKLTLKKGTYKFVCDPHASFMKGSFRVS